MQIQQRKCRDRTTHAEKTDTPNQNQQQAATPNTPIQQHCVVQKPRVESKSHKGQRFSTPHHSRRGIEEILFVDRMRWTLPIALTVEPAAYAFLALLIHIYTRAERDSPYDTDTSIPTSQFQFPQQILQSKSRILPIRQ
jgi:hypothetical protein